MKQSGCRHIYFFSSFNLTSVSARCRGLYPLEYLKEKHGIQFSFVYPGYRLNEIFHFAIVFVEVLFFRKRNSVIVFHKLHNAGVYTRCLKLLLFFRKSATVYDTDDADYIRYGSENIYHFAKKCSICFVGSDFLKLHLENFNSKVFRLTSPVLDHGKISEARNQKLHLGWVGDFGLNRGEMSAYCHKRSVSELLIPALKKVSFDLKLTILGIRNPEDAKDIRGVLKDQKNIELDFPLNVNWMNEEEVYRRIAQFDIGLSPLIDHEFNRAKSAFKAKQYLSCGVPVLASPVGENCKFVRHGENGYLCRDSDEFYKSLTTFQSMEEAEYRSFSDYALKIKDSFSVEGFGAKFFKLLDREFFLKKVTSEDGLVSEGELKQ